MGLDKIRNFIIKELKNSSLSDCYYHGEEHSLEVEQACVVISEHEGNLTDKELELLRIAALSHDIGHIDSMKNHEILGCNFVIRLMPKYGYSPEEIELVKSLILATKFPHKPKTILENIICDADLSYLGTDKYEMQANKLKKELVDLHDYELEEEVDWLKFQINFLEKHVYFTKYANEKYMPNKKLIIEKLKNKLTLL